MKNLLKTLPVLAVAVTLMQPALAQDSTRTKKARRAPKPTMTKKDTTGSSASKKAYVPLKTFGGAKPYAVWSIGVNGGAFTPTVAWGGLNQFSKNELNVGYGGFIKYQFNHAFGARVDYLGGKLKASNEASKDNSSFVAPAGIPGSIQAETKVTYMASIKAEVDVASINFLHRKNGVRFFLTGGYGLAGFKPNNYGDKTIQAGFVPLGAGLKFKLGEAFAVNVGYDAYLFDGSNLLGIQSQRLSKASFGYAGLEWVFGAGNNKPALVWNNPIAVLYDELKSNDSLAKEISGVKTRVTAAEGDVSNLKKDSDGDGVSDVFDKCPNTPAGTKVDGSGCELPKPEPVQTAAPAAKISDEEILVVREAFKNLTFVTGKTTIVESSNASLDKLAAIMNNKANLSLTLKGYTDNVGKPAANIKLSQGRATAVKTYLIGKGVAENRITAKGYGKAHPIASNKTAAGRAKNRRVEFNLF